MKTAILCAGHAQPHAGWVAIDEFADLLVHYLGAALLSPRRKREGWVRRAIGDQRQRYETLPSGGADVLVVVAHSPADLTLIETIPDCRRKFARIHAWVTDSYFHAGFPRATTAYDSITVTAHEDVEFVRTRFGIPVHHLYQGADCLTWAPRCPMRREIDLIGYGRIPPSYHDRFKSVFHAVDSPHLYLHSPLGSITGPGVHAERGMLFKLLQRTRISLAFHLYVEPQGDRPRSMMVTSRWLESLLSGCIVAGKRPTSRMADEMLDWPGATVELSDDPRQASEELRDLFSRDEELVAQRRSNIRHMLQRHDWRDRIRQMCRLFEWSVPPALDEDLGRVRALAAQFA